MNFYLTETHPIDQIRKSYDEKIDKFLNKINEILSNGNMSTYFSILNKEETLNRMDSDLKFIDEHKDKINRGYVHDSIVCLDADREYIERISIDIKREINYLCCISWRYYEGDENIQKLHDGIMISSSALVRRSRDGSEEAFEIKEKVISVLRSFGENELIDQIKNSYIKIFSDVSICTQSPKNIKSYVSILNNFNKQYKDEHQIKIVNNSNVNLLGLNTFCKVLRDKEDEINSLFAEMHDDFINILRKVFENKKSYFNLKAFNVSIYDMYKQYLDEFGFIKLSHLPNQYILDTYNYRFDVSLKRYNKDNHSFRIEMTSRIKKSNNTTAGCSAYVKLLCLCK